METGNPNAVQDFNMLWIAEFKRTHAYEVWNRITDSMLFDIVEPRCVRSSVTCDQLREADIYSRTGTHAASGRPSCRTLDCV